MRYVKKMNIYLACISKCSSNQDKQMILLVISNEEEWHYLAVNNLSALLRGISSKHDGDFTV